MAIYLDHAATTPIHPLVREAMLPFLGELFGNPSSIHQFGRQVRNAVDHARDQLARALHTSPRQLTFTSGGTEADNLALVGTAFAAREGGKDHIITSAVEHHAVLDCCAYLQRLGFRITILPVDKQGLVSINALREAIDDKTALVSIMMGNNEVGTRQPIGELGAVTKEAGAYFHTDAVQAFGIEELNVQALPVDLITLSGHKINGPKGVGALWMSEGVPLWSQMNGGQQERRRRAGTENVAGIVGFGVAAELAMKERKERREHLQACRSTMTREWKQQAIPFEINGQSQGGLPHILNVSLLGTETATMLMNLDLEGIACASGSACTSGTLEVSHVLTAMGLSSARTKSAIRFSFGLGNTPEEIKAAALTVAETVKRLSI